MKNRKYYISLFCPLLLMALLTVVFGDTQILLTSLLYVTVMVEYIENPVSLQMYFKKSKFPPWVTSGQKVYYWGWYVAMLIVWIYLFCIFPEKINEYTDKDWLVFAVALIFGVVAGLRARKIILQNAPEDVGTVGDFFQSVEDEEIMDTYVSVESFNTVDDAEAFQKELEEAGIPSMLYGANKPDYIPDNAFKVQVMVRKRYHEAVARYMENRKS